MAGAIEAAVSKDAPFKSFPASGGSRFKVQKFKVRLEN